MRRPCHPRRRFQISPQAGIMGSPVGELVTSTFGNGSGQIALPAFAAGSRQETIRFACAGAGDARLIDQSGALVVRASGCDGTTVYVSVFNITSSDQTLLVEVGPDVSWEIAIWQG